MVTCLFHAVRLLVGQSLRCVWFICLKLSLVLAPLACCCCNLIHRGTDGKATPKLCNIYWGIFFSLVVFICGLFSLYYPNGGSNGAPWVLVECGGGGPEPDLTLAFSLWAACVSGAGRPSTCKEYIDYKDEVFGLDTKSTFDTISPMALLAVLICFLMFSLLVFDGWCKVQRLGFAMLSTVGAILALGLLGYTGYLLYHADVFTVAKWREEADWEYMDPSLFHGLSAACVGTGERNITLTYGYGLYAMAAVAVVCLLLIFILSWPCCMALACCTACCLRYLVCCRCCYNDDEEKEHHGK